MSPTPKRYRFDNEMPSFEPRPLPVQRPEASVGQSPMQVPAYYEQQQYAQPQVIHVHQAPPDRTLQRVALGSGIGAGATAATAFLGPLLVASLTAMVWILLAGALGVAVLGWAIVQVTGSLKPVPAKGRRRR